MEGSTVSCQTMSYTVRKQTLFLKRWCTVMKRKQTHFKFPVNAVKVSHKNNMYICTMTMFLQSDISYVTIKSSLRTPQRHMGKRRHISTLH